MYILIVQKKRDYLNNRGVVFGVRLRNYNGIEINFLKTCTFTKFFPRKGPMT